MSTVFRVVKDGNYTVLSNQMLRDPRLSFRAKGLLAYMLSVPPDWDYTLLGLTLVSSDGKDAVRKALANMEAAGYLTRRRTHAQGGRFAANEYIITEAPPLAEDAVLPSSDFPTLVKPTLDLPTLENPTQVNTNRLNTIPPIAPQEAAAETPDIAPKQTKPPAWKDQPDWAPERFAGFWACYPKHKSKQAAMRAWDKLKPNDITIARMGRALILQKQQESWLRDGGSYIPYPATWLNGAMWEDEVDLPGGAQEGGHCWAEDREVI